MASSDNIWSKTVFIENVRILSPNAGLCKSIHNIDGTGFCWNIQWFFLPSCICHISMSVSRSYVSKMKLHFLSGYHTISGVVNTIFRHLNRALHYLYKINVYFLSVGIVKGSDISANSYNSITWTVLKNFPVCVSFSIGQCSDGSKVLNLIFKTKHFLGLGFNFASHQRIL